MSSNNSKNKLRDYQQTSVDKVLEVLRGNNPHNTVLALPTGAGKTYVIGSLVEEILKVEPKASLLIVAHVKEILSQNSKTLKQFVPRKKLGLYSAGLGSKVIKQVTVAGIHSIYSKKNKDIPSFDYIIIDECHRVPYLDDKGKYSMYASLINKNPNAPIIGLTATPFRLGGGYIYGDEKHKIFKSCCYDLTSIDNFNKLITDGYLCPILTYTPLHKYDLKGIKTVMKDYDRQQLSERFSETDITQEALVEVVKIFNDTNLKRKKMLIFCIDIAHAKFVTDILNNDSSTKCKAIHSKLKAQERDKIISKFKQGKINAIANVDILTTGFDVADIDLIIMLRPTQSPIIHVQTLGRGLRIAEGKKDCRVIDFAGNLQRLGAINDVDVLRERKGKGHAPIKVCPECGFNMPISIMVCSECGWEFKTETERKLTGMPSSVDAIRKTSETFERCKVCRVIYLPHISKAGNDSVAVTYLTDKANIKITEYLSFHSAGCQFFTNRWLSLRGITSEVPNSSVFLEYTQWELPVPISLLATTKNTKYPKLRALGFEDKEGRWGIMDIHINKPYRIQIK